MSAQNKIVKEGSTYLNGNELMLEAVSVSDPVFPTGNFSITNADYFINSFKAWSTSNPTHYKSLVMGSEKADRITLIREEYRRLSADQQAALKSFLKDMEKFTSMQKSMSGGDKNVYLLTKEDFKKLQSILQK
jgi:hypothetical protein